MLLDYHRKIILPIMLSGTSTIFLLSFLMTSISAENINSITLFPPENKPFGLSYEQHVINYNKFILSIPVDKNPSTDEKGENCAYKQNINNSSIFYLTGGSGGEYTRICHMNSGLGLFIPIIEVEASTAEVPGATIERLHQIAKKDQDNVNSLYLKINDKEYEYDDLKKYRTHTKDFEVTFPDDALFGVEPGLSKVVADGHYVITNPLSPGNYVIKFGGSLVCFGVDCIEPMFATMTTYNLIVK